MARQETPRNIEPSPFLIISQSSWHPSCQHILPKPLTYNVPKMTVRIDYTAPNLMPTSQAMLCRSCLLSHITRMCTTLHFHQPWHPWGSRASSSTLKADSFPRVSMKPSRISLGAFLSYRST